MKVLVLGSGGREHALVWKIKQSDRIKEIYCAPGNGGISDIAQVVPISVTDIEKLADFAWEKKIDLTFVGPEVPLVGGVTDLFQKKGLKIFGPNAYCSQLEGSKIFSKKLMKEMSVPTADFEVFTDYKAAKDYIAQHAMPCVIKADGLAAGKGVFVVDSLKKANEALDLILQKKVFGDAGNQVLIEECLVGKELSVIVVTDGDTITPFVMSQDYKRALDNGLGLNTGGMGSYSPADFISDEMVSIIIENCVRPIVTGLKDRGHCFKGILYAGLMITEDGPKVLEYNVRSGDPETQVILPRMKSDLVDIAVATLENNLKNCVVEWEKLVCVTVVAASGGYPGSYEKGKEITGLSEVKKMEDVIVFHAGTTKEKIIGADDKYFTAGGRVLNVTGLGVNIEQARALAYKALEKINFDGMFYRKDIANIQQSVETGSVLSSE